MNSGMRQFGEDIEDRVKELESENQILKMKNKDELNTKLLLLDTKLDDEKRNNEKLKYQIELNEKSIKNLEEENDQLRAEIDAERGDRDNQTDQTKEIQRL